MSDKPNDNRIVTVHFKESQRFGGNERLVFDVLKDTGWSAILTAIGVRFYNESTDDAFTVPISSIRRIGHPKRDAK